MLQDAGYSTYMSGKWHVGERPQHWPRVHGFERYFGLISGASSYDEIITDQPRKRQMVLDDAPWIPPDSGFYMTDAFADYAVELLQSHPTDQPFLLYLADTVYTPWLRIFLSMNMSMISDGIIYAVSVMKECWN